MSHLLDFFIIITALSSTISDFGLKIGKPKRASRTKKIPIIAAATRRSAFFPESSELIYRIIP
jgi:hypothetical protein